MGALNKGAGIGGTVFRYTKLNEYKPLSNVESNLSRASEVCTAQQVARGARARGAREATLVRGAAAVS